jgi:hypothetical protein
MVTPQIQGEKDVGENILFDNLPDDYEIYLFYYSGPLRNSNLENRLKDFGRDTGKNLFVDIASLKDQKYKLLATQFEIESFPAVIITGNEKLASLKRGDSYSTAFVRLDKKELLKDSDKTIECVGNIFTLFMSGKVSDALQEAKDLERKAIISQLKNSILTALKGILGFLKENDISFSLFEGKLEIKKKGE